MVAAATIVSALLCWMAPPPIARRVSSTAAASDVASPLQHAFGRRAVLSTAGIALGSILSSSGSLPAAAAEEAPLTGSQLLTAGEYLRDLRDARKGLDALKPLLEENTDSGYEKARLELRKPPVSGIRKAASKLITLLPDGSYKKTRDAQYTAIKASLGAIDDGCRPEAKRGDLLAELAKMQENMDLFTAGYGYEQ